PISSVTVMGTTMVIINDAQIAAELLEKRSSKHSSRPKQTFAGEMIGWDNSLALLPYNDRLRTYRMHMNRIIGTKPAASQFHSLQEAEVGHFLLHLLDQPEDLVPHIQKEAGSVILKIAYGYTTEPFKNDLLVDMLVDAMDKFSVAAVPGAFMVDMLPSLRYLPEWIPGMGFKKTAHKWGAELTDVVEKPYVFVNHLLAQGSDRSSFLSRLIEADNTNEEKRFINKWSALSLYTAGSDTIVSTISCFFLAMTVYPEVQRKAQEEIDRVVGQDRLPTFADRENLPYVEATVKEVLRWHPVGPMGLPHTSTEDDIFEGYFIPKGSILFANIWHFTHDPEVYEDPMSFNPERFLAKDGHEPAPDPRTLIFGFGRRVCPGRNLADNSLYLNVAQVLAVFDIGKEVQGDKEIEPTIKFTPGIISRPEPYQNSVKPRSPHHEMLIRSIEKTHPWEESDGSVLENTV
ncbi:Cytochrome P450, partial [Geosmithia morbida]